MTITVQYEHRDLLAAVTKAKMPSSFLFDLLNKGEETHETDQIEIDVVAGDQKMSAYSTPLGNGEYVGKEGYATYIHKLPYTKQLTSFTAKDLNDRIPGETIYESGIASRSDRKIGEALAKFRNRNLMRREYQLAEAIQTGYQTISGDFVSYTINYQRDASNTGAARTGDNRWGQVSATIMADIRAGAKQMRAPGVFGGYPRVMLLGETAAEAFVDSDEIVEKLDNRRMEMGQIAPRLLESNDASYLGTLQDVGLNLEVWSYFGQYVDSSDAAQYLFDPNGMALINTDIRVTTHYSMISNFHSGNFVGREFPYFWISENGSVANIQLESGFIVATHEPNKIYYRSVGNA